MTGRIADYYERVLHVLCVLAGAALALIVVMVIINVIGRSTHLFSLNWVPAISEYLLQFATMLAAPWILHRKGHIFMTVAHDALPALLSKVLEKLVYLLCLTLCWGVAGLAALATAEQYTSGAIDMRSIDIPGWVLYASLIPGFGLMGIEFLIFLLGGESMLRTDEARQQGI